MYKDVWKKFGVKVFIVLCSVLLVGGVAVAAPRLRAADKPTLDDVQNWVANSGAAITINDNEKIEYEPNSEGIYPRKIEVVNPNGGTVTIGQDDYRVVQGATIGDVHKAGDVTITITSANNLSNDAEIGYGGNFTFKYTISPAGLPAGYDVGFETNDHDAYGAQETDLIVGDKTVEIAKSHIKEVFLSSGSDKILIDAADYNIEQQSGSNAGELGDRKINIILRNYAQDDARTNCIWEKTCKVVKNIYSLANGTSSADIKVIDPQASPSLLTAGTHYTKTGTTTVVIRGNRDNNYVGERTFTFGENEELPIVAFDPSISNDYEYGVKEYDGEGGSGFQYRPALIITNESDTPLSATQYTVEYKIVDNNDQEIPGATAGTVQMTITVNKSSSKFNGKTASNTLQYRVRRNIKDALFVEPDEPGDYNYEPGVVRKKQPKICFADTNQPLEDKDVTVQYYLAKRRDTGYLDKVLTNNPIDAGIVYMRVIGSLGENPNGSSGGYYGVLDSDGWQEDKSTYGQYEIIAQELSSNQVLRLQQSEQIREFPVSNDEPKIGVDGAGVAYIYNTTTGRYSPINPDERNTEYTVRFFKDEACTVPIESTEWGSLSSEPTYYVQYHYISNYNGYLKAPFKLHAYTAEEIDVEFVTGADGCEGGTECVPAANGNGHIYNGKDHMPKITVTTNGQNGTTSGRVLTEHIDYEKTYSPDIKNVTESAKVIVTLTSTKETKEKTFRISPLSINNDSANGGNADITLALPSEYSPKLEYSGRAERPKLKTLTFDKIGWGRDGITMNNLLDYDSSEDPSDDTARQDFNVLNLYEQQQNGSWQVVVYSATSKPTLKLNTNYRFQVEGIGNYTGIGYTPEFQFEQRDISKADFKNKPESMPNGNKDTSEADILSFIRSKTTGVKLEDLNAELDYDQNYDPNYPENASGDYIIEFAADKRLTDGLIEYTIKGTGCYTGEITEVLYIGRDIAETVLYELDDPIMPGSNGIKYLNEPYSINTASTGSADRYNLPFWMGDENIQALDETIYFLYNKGLPSERETLIKDQHYLVSFGRAQDKNPGSPDGQYCDVTIKGINGYYGTTTFRFDIVRIDINNCIILIEGIDFRQDAEKWTYTGNDIEPEVWIFPAGTAKTDQIATNPNRLKLGTDYRVDYSNNKFANELDYQTKSVINIIGLSAYSGTDARREFTIKQRSLNRQGAEIIAAQFKLRESDDTVGDGEKLGGKYKYTTTSTVTLPNGQTSSSNGVCPQFEIFFDPLGTWTKTDINNYMSLTLNTDFILRYEKNTHVYDSTQPGVDIAESPVVIVEAQGTNFKGSFKVRFDIQAINLAECVVKMTNRNIPFRGSSVSSIVEPLVEVYQIEKDANGNDVEVFLPRVHKESDAENAPEVTEYVVHVENDIYVPNVSNGQGAGMPTVWVERSTTGNCIGDTSKQPYYFNIMGDLSNNSIENPLGAENSKVLWDDTYINYSVPFDIKTALTKIENMRFRQREAGTENWLTNYLDENDYDIKLDALTIGDYIATVTGKGYYENSAQVPVIVRANLSDMSYMTYEYPQTFTYVTGQAIDFKSLIKVKCGDQYLEYGKHYRFRGGEDALKSTPGTGYSVTIENVPVDEGGVDYVTGAFALSYDIKAGIGNSATISLGRFDDDTEARYEYAHGADVFNPRTEIRVVVGGTELTQGTDYTVEIIGDLKNCGQKTVKITGINSYEGEATRNFTIYEYDLAVHKDIVSIDAKNSVVYNGGNVFPDMDVSVIVSGTSKKLNVRNDESEDAAEYVVERDTGDTVNWTHDPNNKPTFAVQGVGNYTGRITGNAYTITRKPISDPDVEFPLLEEGLPYQNGREIRIVPKGTYNGRDLIGEERDPNKEDQYLNSAGNISNQFTYKYQTQDLKNIGTKEVLIEGIGNFTGSRPWSYEVVALHLQDTILTFDDESLVYDGREQRPSFKLTYGSDVIATFTGTQLVSEWIPNLQYKFDDNIDAGTATVRLWIDESVSDNYTGEKVATFTIQPASIAGHTKFLYRPTDSNENVDLSTYKLNLPFDEENHSLVRPQYAVGDENGKLAELPSGQVGIYFDFASKRNHGDFLVVSKDYEADIEYKYVLPDTDDEPVREEDYPDPNYGYAGKVKVTIKGMKNYTDSASFWYFIGTDISADASITMKPTTAVYNSQAQPPVVTVSGISDVNKYKIAKYKNEIALENIIDDSGFVNAGTYYIRIEGNPANGTYATKPHTLIYTITPRAFSNNLVIDGFKREYSYTGYEIRPVGISVTDYIDNVKYKLTEDVDYTLTYTNNLNAGTAYINVEGKSNFSGKATANFLITSSTISSGGSNGNNSFLDQGTGEISGATAVSPSNVNMSMDTIDAMYYTGSPVYPKVSIAGMTENVDYTVTFSNNVEVGTAVATISGIGNNTGTIVKNFRIIAQLSKCTISPIPAQQYTGSEVKPSLTVRCGNSILMEGTDYTVTYSNNINIGTATATIRALNNANYTGSASVNFSIGNDVGGFIISGYAPSYAYTGNAITPGVVVETGSRTLTPGTDYTVSYSNNVNAGTATITVTGTGRYSGTQTANFIIEPKSMQSLTTTDIADRTYTGDAYTPDITVSDGGKVLTKGVDYTVTYTNNINPGTASILIQGTSSNYTGTKVVSFKIAAVAVKGLKASSIKYNSLKLRWTNQGYADGYQICDSKSKLVKTVKTNSATITGLTAGKVYKYKVRSYIRNADGTRSYGAFSSVLSTTTKLKTPTVKVVSNTKGQARISWSKVSGATGYEIYYKKTASAKYKKLKTVNNANIRVCTVRGLKSGDRAYFRVRAFRKNGSKKVYSSLNPLKVITVK